MLFFTRCGLAIVRWLIQAGMLMLIILLLFMDTPDRRPFVQRLALSIVAVVQSDWAKDLTPADPGAEPSADPSEPAPEEFEPWHPPEPSPSDRRSGESALPADFVAQLEQAVARSRDRQARDAWTEFAAAQGRAAQVASAVRLARHLPQQWWTLDGELVNQLDLAAVLCNRERR